MAAIPHGADNDSSYEAKATMTDADGNTYYVKKQPAPPINLDYPGPGAVPHKGDGTDSTGVADTSPDITVTRDDDRRLHTSDGTKI